MGRRKMSKFRFRLVLLTYVALGCILPYYVMKHADDEELYQQHCLEQNKLHTDNKNGGVFTSMDGTSTPEVVYRRRAFFEDITTLLKDNATERHPLLRHHEQQQEQQQQHQQQLQRVQQQQQQQQRTQYQPSNLTPLRQHRLDSLQRQQRILEEFDQQFKDLQDQNKMTRVKTAAQYQVTIDYARRLAIDFARKKLKPAQFWMHGEHVRIPGTLIDTPAKTARFRMLMEQALDQGRWVYEPDRDYPDFGGATGWSKKKQNERDRDVAIDRPPFPEAGKYHWEPLLTKEQAIDTGMGTDTDTDNTENEKKTQRKAIVTHEMLYTPRIHPEDFCRLLGSRHIVLVGDLIHWQLHDSILYNMFDTPQICYGDMACHLGVGHPLCPLPNDVRLKFVRNDLLSPTRNKVLKSNEWRTQHPVEMAWLKDLKLKDTVILGAPQYPIPDLVFRKTLSKIMLKIRTARPEALIIYRSNHMGHPDCPSKYNNFNVDKEQHQNASSESLRQQQQQVLYTHTQKDTFINHRPSFGAPARPLENDTPLEEFLQYPLNWSHYPRQNQIAKAIVEGAGGIYWNIATMTNRRPDGHVGGHDCLSYRRPGPTDEWAVSLYNLFRTIEKVELES
ncbi:hypothetical protein BGZ94_004599 [Podila epigama]|nr:hypothetical protein BGZ94_004599 [Podila epigama]